MLGLGYNNTAWVRSFELYECLLVMSVIERTLFNSSTVLGLYESCRSLTADNVCCCVTETASNCSVVPLTYSAEESVLIVRSTYTDHETNVVVTDLLAVDTHYHNLLSYVGNAVSGVSSMAVEFVKATGMLLVVYSSSAELTSIEGTAVCLGGS